MFRVLSAFVLAFALACPAGALEFQGSPRVIDGDTLDLAGVRVRLQGVDAPERGQTCLDAAGQSWPCGDWARDALHALLQGGGRLTCHDLGERTHSRVVARCDLGGQDLAGLLVARGVVRACPRYAVRHPHSESYMALETVAIAQRRGLHAGDSPPLAGFCTPPAAQVMSAAGQEDARDCAIKGNIARDGARIYHLPGQRHYDATVIDARRGERWFCSEAEAQGEGWRRARR